VKERIEGLSRDPDEFGSAMDGGKGAGPDPPSKRHDTDVVAGGGFPHGQVLDVVGRCWLGLHHADSLCLARAHTGAATVARSREVGLAACPRRRARNGPWPASTGLEGIGAPHLERHWFLGFPITDSVFARADITGHDKNGLPMRCGEGLELAVWRNPKPFHDALLLLEQPGESEV